MGRGGSNRGGLILGAEAGYLYDWNRQHQQLGEEGKNNCKKLKKKIDKVTKKNKNLKHKKVMFGLTRNHEDSSVTITIYEI